MSQEFGISDPIARISITLLIGCLELGVIEPIARFDITLLISSQQLTHIEPISKFYITLFIRSCELGPTKEISILGITLFISSWEAGLIVPISKFGIALFIGTMAICWSYFNGVGASDRMPIYCFCTMGDWKCCYPATACGESKHSGCCTFNTSLLMFMVVPSVSRMVLQAMRLTSIPPM